jgi:hypothetical protein
VNLEVLYSHDDYTGEYGFLFQSLSTGNSG